jgi:hypothetical protein
MIMFLPGRLEVSLFLLVTLTTRLVVGDNHDGDDAVLYEGSLAWSYDANDLNFFRLPILATTWPAIYCTSGPRVLAVFKSSTPIRGM